MRRPHRLHSAVSLFTIVPVPPVDMDADTARRALSAFPLVGALVGVMAGIVGAAVWWFGGGTLLAAGLGVGVLALATGGMHLDGLADTADGLASRLPAERALAIMKKSDVGPMGVGTLVLVLLCQVFALGSPRVATPAALAVALVTGPVIGRLVALAGTTPTYPAAHAGGFAALCAGLTSRRSLAGYTAGYGLLVVTATAACGGAHGAAVALGGATTALALGAAWRHHLVKRLGGLTGDTWGSLVELGQLAFWIVLAVAW